MRWIWTCFFLLITGCAVLGPCRYTKFTPVSQHPQIYSVYLDARFDTYDRLAIRQALSQWNYVFNGYAAFVVVDEHFDMEKDGAIAILQQSQGSSSFFIFDITSGNPMVTAEDQALDKEHPGWRALAFVPHLGGHYVYLVRDRLEDSQITPVCLHELAHTFGAVHTADGIGLMSVPYDGRQYRCVDYHTMQQVATNMHWDPNNLNYCVVEPSTK